MIPGGIFLSKLLLNIKELTKNKEIKIGEGNFGTVLKGAIPPKRGKPEIPCAIKILKYTEFKDEDERDRFFREVGCQYSLKHEAVLPLLGCSIPIMSDGGYAIVTKFMEKGSLSSLIHKVSKGDAPDNWETIRAINIFGIAAGLAFVHQNKVIHRDVKSDNVMLDSKYYPKIADFGFSKIFEEGTQDQINMTRKIGTPIYMAPELLIGDNYSNKVDVFAFAMLLYELLTLRKPWSDKKDFKEKKFNLVSYIEKGQRPTILDKEISDKFKDLIKRCWETDPNARPTFVDIVNQLDDEKEDFFYESGLVDQEEFQDYVDLVKEKLILENLPQSSASESD